jgi:glutamine amidotransferase
MTNNIKIAIIDYNMCNIFSVKHACIKAGMEPVITSNPDEIITADGVILPGVGAFGDAMNNLKSLKLIDPLRYIFARDKPLMCICLGMQLLFSESEEFGINKGLDFIPGTVKIFPSSFNNNKLKIPFIGWNNIVMLKSNYCLDNIENNSYMYFVHSYYVTPSQNTFSLTSSSYDGFEYCSSITKGNIIGFQFHPEKSGDKGISIYNNWRLFLENRRMNHGNA